MILVIWLPYYQIPQWRIRQFSCDDFPTGKAYNEGEYLVLINKSGTVSSRSGIDLDLSAYTLHVGNDSRPLQDTLPAGDRIILGFGADLQNLMRTTAIPSAYERNVVLQTTFKLQNRGGIVSVVHQSGAAIDVFSYGDFYGIEIDSIDATIGEYPTLFRGLNLTLSIAALGISSERLTFGLEVILAS